MLACFLDSLLAFAFTMSLYSLNLLMIFWLLWIFNILSILQMGFSFFNQFDWNTISTMVRAESTSPSSDTVYNHRAESSSPNSADDAQEQAPALFSEI
jgi:hypothetical protein